MSKPQRPFVPLNVALLTLSNTRTRADDTSGDLIQERLETAGHRVAQRTILPEVMQTLHDQLRGWIADAGIDVIISNGGTGITQHDIAPQALQPFITQSIPGFGELFRMLSYTDIGTSTIQSRAEAAVAGSTVVFLIPGSTNACRLAMDKIILSQLDASHRPCNLVGLLPRYATGTPA